LKIHHFDLSKAIQDVSLLADSTKGDAKKTMRKLNLRERLITDPSEDLTNAYDLAIWKYAIRNQVNALEDSITECDKIIVTLKKI
jgi:hypothetical protein